jgi:hypothetical protein
VDPGEVGDIEKPFDLAAGKAVHFKGRAVDLLKAGRPSAAWSATAGVFRSNARQVQISP